MLSLCPGDTLWQPTHAPNPQPHQPTRPPATCHFRHFTLRTYGQTPFDIYFCAFAVSFRRALRTKFQVLLSNVIKVRGQNYCSARKVYIIIKWIYLNVQIMLCILWGNQQLIWSNKWKSNKMISATCERLTNWHLPHANTARHALTDTHTHTPTLMLLEGVKRRVRPATYAYCARRR